MLHLFSRFIFAFFGPSEDSLIVLTVSRDMRSTWPWAMHALAAAGMVSCLSSMSPAMPCLGA